MFSHSLSKKLRLTLRTMPICKRGWGLTVFWKSEVLAESNTIREVGAEVGTVERPLKLAPGEMGALE